MPVISNWFLKLSKIYHCDYYQVFYFIDIFKLQRARRNTVLELFPICAISAAHRWWEEVKIRFAAPRWLLTPPQPPCLMSRPLGVCSAVIISVKQPGFPKPGLCGGFGGWAEARWEPHGCSAPVPPKHRSLCQNPGTGAAPSAAQPGTKRKGLQGAVHYMKA